MLAGAAPESGSGLGHGRSARQTLRRLAGFRRQRSRSDSRERLLRYDRRRSPKQTYFGHEAAAALVGAGGVPSLLAGTTLSKNSPTPTVKCDS